MWDVPIDLPTWITNWGVGRCGAAPASLAGAYVGMLNTVYVQGQPHALHHFYANTMNYLQGGGHGTNPWTNIYNPTDVVSSLDDMLKMAPECKATAYEFDLVDLTRELLLVAPGACYYNCMVKGIESNSSTMVAANSKLLQEVCKRKLTVEHKPSWPIRPHETGASNLKLITAHF